MSKKLPKKKTHRTFDKQKRARARELFDEGFGCNAIARELDVSASTISVWAKENDLRFDRSQTALAVRANTIDLAEERTLLAKKMLQAAHDALDSLDEPFLVYSFGGKENDYNEHELERPTVDAQRQIMTTAGIAFDKVTRILEKSDPGLEGAIGVLDALSAGFSNMADKYRAEEVTDESDGD